MGEEPYGGLCYISRSFYRIQDRLFRLTDEASEHLHFAVASCKLTDGLVGPLEEYLKECPATRLIVIDTLQKVRTAPKDNAPNVITKQLNEYHATILRQNNIRYVYRRTKGVAFAALERYTKNGV